MGFAIAPAGCRNLSLDRQHVELTNALQVGPDNGDRLCNVLYAASQYPLSIGSHLKRRILARDDTVGTFPERSTGVTGRTPGTMTRNSTAEWACQQTPTSDNLPRVFDSPGRNGTVCTEGSWCSRECTGCER